MHTAETLTLASLPSGVPVQTTVHIYGDAAEPRSAGRRTASDDGDADGGDTGDGDGPTVYVQAAQHGREINGTEVLRRVHERLDADDLSGTLVAVPVSDPLTFDRVSYTTPESLDALHSNMNRVWPGDADGSLHERMAAALWEYAGDADYIVDLHTGSPEMSTHTVYLDGDDDCRRLAEAFGTELLLAEAAGEDADVEWSERDFGGKLRVAATREGIPAITPELAHNKQLVEPAIEAGVRGVFNVLREVGALPGDPETPPVQTTARNHLGRVTAAESGLFHPADVELGREVTAGDHLGRVVHPTTYETLQAVTADRGGVVYSVRREATVTAGQTLVGVALPVEEN